MIEWQMLSRRFLHQQWRPCEGNGGWLRLPTWFFIFSDSEFSFYAVWLAAAIFGFHSAFQRMRSVNDLCKQCNDFGTFLIGHFCKNMMRWELWHPLKMYEHLRMFHWYICSVCKNDTSFSRDAIPITAKTNKGFSKNLPHHDSCDHRSTPLCVMRPNENYSFLAAVFTTNAVITIPPLIQRFRIRAPSSVLHGISAS